MDKCNDDFYTLGIESSCDETAVAIYSEKKGLIAHQLHSQIAIHNKYGGVVPELASREHILKVIPLLKKTLTASNINIRQINGIAYTKGPGLAGALLVGSSIAKSLAYSLNIPSLGINHMEGHLLAPLLEVNKPKMPFICLLVSGGHTMLLEVSDFGKYKLLGETLDDSAGEAFDKTAKLLGLGYPGGAKLSKLAQNGNKTKFNFPRPLLNKHNKNNLDFSFSGLKTFAKNTIVNNPDNLADIACCFENAVCDVLTTKSIMALQQRKLSTLVVSGGVSANSTLRNSINNICHNNNIKVFYPRIEFCTDNAAMIALAGHIRLIKKQKDTDNIISIKPRWPLEDLNE